MYFNHVFLWFFFLPLLTYGHWWLKGLSEIQDFFGTPLWKWMKVMSLKAWLLTLTERQPIGSLLAHTLWSLNCSSWVFFNREAHGYNDHHCVLQCFWQLIDFLNPTSDLDKSSYLRRRAGQILSRGFLATRRQVSFKQRWIESDNMSRTCRWTERSFPEDWPEMAPSTTLEQLQPGFQMVGYQVG